MKMRFLLFSLFLFVGGPALIAQLPAATGHNILLDVENKGAGGSTSGSLGGGATGFGAGGAVGTTSSTATQAQTHTTTLAITIRSQDKTPTQVQVEWYFFAKKIQGSRVSKDSLLDSGNKSITVQPTGSETFDVTSKPARTATSRTYTTTTSYNGTTGNTTSSTLAGPDTRSGTKISGWVVRILVDGKVLDAKGSEFKFEDAAKDPDKFAALMAGK